MRCDGCKKWTVKRVTNYGNGEQIVNWSAPDGKGNCSHLNMDTPADFGCTAFDQAADSSIHVVKNFKNGAPWQHWVAIPCPDCSGAGSGDGGACRRCAGVGKVQRHDDGYVSDNHTKIHPKERDNIEPLKCQTCGEPVADVKWKACPMCGARLEPMAETENVQDGVMFYDTSEKRADQTRKLATQIKEMNKRNEGISG